jgi:hypothetical protein
MINNNPTVFDNSKDLIEKEAVTKDYFELGEIQEVGIEFVITQKGIIDKEIFYIPKRLVDRFDSIHLWFNITKEEAEQYKRD